MAENNTTLQVKGMSCEHCVHAIETALNELNGVKTVHVDLKTDKVSVTYDESAVSLEKVKEAIDDQGYDVV